ncbi:hypothetical protein QEG73_00995 [Chitinophagaceae bacterium 26-R-25]|nr:hypothetical protein [Chitinophagaceae bacterium 26-R-25]
MGVHSAMLMKETLSLCPDAIVRRGDMDCYSRQSRLFTSMTLNLRRIVTVTNIKSWSDRPGSFSLIKVNSISDRELTLTSS